MMAVNSVRNGFLSNNVGIDMFFYCFAPRVVLKPESERRAVELDSVLDCIDCIFAAFLILTDPRSLADFYLSEKHVWSLLMH